MKQFELLVRALIVKNKRILVCQTEGGDYFFLPGGHIEFSETMQQALQREVMEELGAKVLRSQFIGGVENLFSQLGEEKHEISFLYHVEIDIDDVKSLESHIRFCWFDYEEFVNQKIVPPAMKDAVIAWIVERKPFFIEMKNEND